MSNQNDPKYIRVAQLAWQVIDESVLILEPKTKKAHELNHVASFIWQSLDGSKTQAELVEAVSVEYDVEKSLIQDEVTDFIEDLKNGQLIECL